jgi:hypothetical protein
MSNLQVFNNDGIELVIDSETGEAFATQSGYARMSGLSKQAVSKRIQGVNQVDIKTAEIVTDGGLQGVNLIPAKTVFKWLIKDNPELAEKMGEAGATVFIYKLAGYEPNAPQVNQSIADIFNQMTEIENACYKLKAQNPDAYRRLSIFADMGVQPAQQTVALYVDTVSDEDKDKKLREQLKDVSLVANRLGLAFNKHPNGSKTVKELQQSLSLMSADYRMALEEMSGYKQRLNNVTEQLYKEQESNKNLAFKLKLVNDELEMFKKAKRNSTPSHTYDVNKGSIELSKKTGNRTRRIQDLLDEL